MPSRYEMSKIAVGAKTAAVVWSTLVAKITMTATVMSKNVKY